MTSSHEDQGHWLLRRCVICPETSPSCPTCKANEVCTQIAQSCTQCASTTCVKLSDSGATNTGEVVRSGGGSNVGAIAGGVVGGIAFIAIITFVVWKFFIKKRQDSYEAGPFQEEDTREKVASDYASRRDPRSSTHTFTSRASSALTRTSNFIQIAYIPGVYNRSGTGDGTIVPPVPPIPAAEGGNKYDGQDQFFVPYMRDSTFSTMTSSTGRGSFARQSIAPSLARSSVATTIYRSNAVINPAPAQTIVRGKAAVVSVKPSSMGSSSDESQFPMPPSMPQSPKRAHGKSPLSTPMLLDVSDDTEAASLNSRDETGAAVGEAVVVKSASKPTLTIPGGSPNPNGESSKPAELWFTTDSPITDGPLQSPLRPISEASTKSGTKAAYTYNAYQPKSAAEGKVGASKAHISSIYSRRDTQASTVTTIHDSPALAQSPFADNGNNEVTSPIDSEDGELSPRTTKPLRAANSTSSKYPRRQASLKYGQERINGLANVIEEATKRASRVPAEGGLGSRGRDESPFSDKHVVEK